MNQSDEETDRIQSTERIRVANPLTDPIVGLFVLGTYSIFVGHIALYLVKTTSQNFCLLFAHHFCREFQALSFDKKSVSIKAIIGEKFRKYKQDNSLSAVCYYLFASYQSV